MQSVKSFVKGKAFELFLFNQHQNESYNLYPSIQKVHNEFNYVDDELNWSEDLLQAKFWEWSWNNYVHVRRCLISVPNSGWRTKIEANKFKATGLVAGAWDMQLVWQSRIWWLELKIGNGFLSDAQVDFGEAQLRQGAELIIGRRLNQLKAVFLEITGEQ